jgi:hypothetical protein
MKHQRVAEYARMILGAVRFADKDTRAQTMHTLHAMLDEERNAMKKEERYPKPADRSKDSTIIDESHAFNAATLAKAGYLAPWKKKLAKALGL